MASKQHPSGHQELPGFCRQENGYVSRIHSKLLVCRSLQQAHIRSVSRQGPAIIYSGQHRHRDASVVAHKRKQANQDLWSALLYVVLHLAPPTPLRSSRKSSQKMERGMGQVAWKAFIVKYSGHTKEARRACHEKLVNTKMEPGQDPYDLFFVLDECRDLLEEIGQPVHDAKCEDIIL